MTTGMGDYFSGRRLAVFLLGVVLLAVLTVLVPAPEPVERHRPHCGRVAALAPWMLTTTFRHKFGTYLLCSLVAVGIMAAIDAMFR